jgi:hypothetical protein
VSATLPAALCSLEVDVQLIPPLDESFGFLARRHAHDFSGIADNVGGALPRDESYDEVERGLSVCLDIPSPRKCSRLRK